MGSFEELKAKGTKIKAEDLQSVDMDTLWKAAGYYSKWLIEDPEFERLRKVHKMIIKEINRRYLAQDEYLRGNK